VQALALPSCFYISKPGHRDAGHHLGCKSRGGGCGSCQTLDSRCRWWDQEVDVPEVERTPGCQRRERCAGLPEARVVHRATRGRIGSGLSVSKPLASSLDMRWRRCDHESHHHPLTVAVVETRSGVVCWLGFLETLLWTR
jgi:hypothetical protein